MNIAYRFNISPTMADLHEQVLALVDNDYEKTVSLIEKYGRQYISMVNPALVDFLGPNGELGEYVEDHASVGGKELDIELNGKRVHLTCRNGGGYYFVNYTQGFENEAKLVEDMIANFDNDCHYVSYDATYYGVGQLEVFKQKIRNHELAIQGHIILLHLHNDTTIIYANNQSSSTRSFGLHCLISVVLSQEYPEYEKAIVDSIYRELDI